MPPKKSSSSSSPSNSNSSNSLKLSPAAKKLAKGAQAALGAKTALASKGKPLLTKCQQDLRLSQQSDKDSLGTINKLKQELIDLNKKYQTLQKSSAKSGSSSSSSSPSTDTVVRDLLTEQKRLTQVIKDKDAKIMRLQAAKTSKTKKRTEWTVPEKEAFDKLFAEQFGAFM